MPVYFVQAGEGGPIKIGFAGDVRRRIAKMQSDCPSLLRVIGVVPDGTEHHEGLFHQRFGASRERGEWFRPSEEILAFASGLSPLGWQPTMRSGKPLRPRTRFRCRPSDKSWTVSIAGATPYRRVLCPSMPGIEGRPAPLVLPINDAEFAEGALKDIRAQDPDAWPGWWLDWLSGRGVSEAQFNRFYDLHLPVRPHGIDLLGGRTERDEPVWRFHDWWGVLWPPAMPFITAPSSEAA